MKLYRLECCDQDGNIEVNGYFLSNIHAEEQKQRMDLYPENIRYGIKQVVIEIETED